MGPFSNYVTLSGGKGGGVGLSDALRSVDIVTFKALRRREEG